MQNGTFCVNLFYNLRNGNDGSFLATAPRDIFIFDFAVGLIGAFDGCMSCLHKHRFDVGTGTCNLRRFLLAGGLIVAGGQAGPTQSFLEESNCAISVPISERIVMVDSRFMPGIVQRRRMAAA